MVNGIGMPLEQELPEDLESLARRQALELRHTRFAADCDAIIRALREILPKRKSRWILPFGRGRFVGCMHCRRRDALAHIAAVAAAGGGGSGPSACAGHNAGSGEGDRQPAAEHLQRYRRGRINGWRRCVSNRERGRRQTRERDETEQRRAARGRRRTGKKCRKQDERPGRVEAPRTGEPRTNEPPRVR